MMDSYILTFFQIHKQRLFRWLTGTWSATERHFCQRVTHVLSKINGKLLSQYLHNQLDLIISIQLISFILFCCKNLLFKTDAICCSARQLHGRSLCWLSLLGLGQVMQDCLESSNFENVLNLFFRHQRQIWSASQHFDCSCHSGERLSLQILRGWGISGECTEIDWHFS